MSAQVARISEVFGPPRPGTMFCYATVAPVPLLELDDPRFQKRWGKMTNEERSALPPEIRDPAFRRIRALTDYVAKSSERAERAERGAATLDERAKRRYRQREPGEDEFETIRTAAEVMRATTGPAKYCVESRVPCGLVIIGGRPKSRKSWYALQLAIAKAAGGRFMGVSTPAGRVLFIALEDNDRRMRQRLEFFGLTPETAPANLHLVYE